MSNTREEQLLLDAYAAGIGKSSPKELAMFMAQVSAESHNLNRLEEGFKYTQGNDQITINVSSALRKGPEALETARQEALDGKPVNLAELMYGGRMKNNDPGDGYKYRGRGYIQLTGKAGYEDVGKDLGLDLVKHPELAADPANASKIAIHFWQKNVPKAVREDILKATHAVNNGEAGLDKRKISYADWQQKLTPEVIAGLAKGEVNLPVTPITDKHHPGHSLYAQTLSGMEKMNAEHKKQHPKSDGPSVQATQNAAAALAVEAHRQGLKHVNAVALSDDNSKLFAVQGKPGTAHSKVIGVDTVGALAASIDISSKAYVQQSKSEPQPTQQQATPQQAQNDKVVIQPAQPALVR